MSNKLDYTIEFVSKKFDVESDLFEDCGKGDQFYGRDVANYLADELKEHCIDVRCIEEDWSWQVSGKIKNDQRFEISVFPSGLTEKMSGNDRYLWRLRLSVRQKGQFLWILPIYKWIKCDDKFLDILKAILSADGFEFRRMEIGATW